MYVCVCIYVCTNVCVCARAPVMSYSLVKDAQIGRAIYFNAHIDPLILPHSSSLYSNTLLLTESHSLTYG
jgi:hypothetical protein